MEKNKIKQKNNLENLKAKFFNRRFLKKVLKIKFLIILILLVIFYFFKLAKNYPRNINLETKSENFFGVTFSTKYSKEIGLDWQEVYLATIDDLEVKEIRLPLYWDEIEKESGVFDFSTYDYILEEGAKRDVKFIVNIGWRLPRWPECHAPEWANKLSLEETRERVLLMLEEVINHYKSYDAIIVWQLENEPFLNGFGICPPSSTEFFDRELSLVKSLDDRPVMVSATGELSLWRKEAKVADVFGTTVYRVVWNNLIGYLRYPIPHWFYSLKAWLFNIPKEDRVVIELQAEPWVPQGSIIYLSEDEARKSFNIDQFKANLQFAINIDFEKAYLWGLEWWYYEYKNGNKAYWELAREIF